MWLAASGYQFGIRDNAKRREVFADYWKKRGDRDYCLGWFKVRLEIASHGTTGEREWDREEIRELRRGIDAIPSPDREWTLITLSAPEFGNRISGNLVPGASILVSEEELERALSHLGIDSVRALFKGDQIAEDPDMVIKGSKWWSAFGYKRVVMTILRHASVVFEPQHAGELLKYGEREAMKEDGLGVPAVWWWKAAADAAPDRAGEILRGGMHRFAEIDATLARGGRLIFVIELGRHLGEGAAPEIADWFFDEESLLGRDRYHLCNFLWQAGRRELRDAVFQDERLDQLDWQTLSRLVSIGIWRGDPPLMAIQDFHKARHPYALADYHLKRKQAAKEYPKETAELEATLASWREKLRSYEGTVKMAE